MLSYKKNKKIDKIINIMFIVGMFSTTDKEGVLDVVPKGKESGVLAYAFELVTPTAAYATEKTNLLGMSIRSRFSQEVAKIIYRMI